MFLKVMANMQKASIFEDFFILTGLSIGGNKACEPIISDADGWYDLSLGAVLETSFTKDGDLLDNLSRLFIWIGG